MVRHLCPPPSQHSQLSQPSQLWNSFGAIDFLPPWLPTLASLKTLRLHGTPCSNNVSATAAQHAVEAALQQLTALTWLDIGETQGASLPAALTALGRLRVLAWDSINFAATAQLPHGQWLAGLLYLAVSVHVLANSMQPGGARTAATALKCLVLTDGGGCRRYGEPGLAAAVLRWAEGQPQLEEVLVCGGGSTLPASLVDAATHAQQSNHRLRITCCNWWAPGTLPAQVDDDSDAAAANPAAIWRPTMLYPRG